MAEGGQRPDSELGRMAWECVHNRSEQHLERLPRSYGTPVRVSQVPLLGTRDYTPLQTLGDPEAVKPNTCPCT